MRSTIYGPDHDLLRKTTRDFLQREAIPRVPQWEKARLVDPEFYRKAGEIGLLGLQIPEEYGGGGQHSFTYNMTVAEEMINAHLQMSPMRVHTDVVLPYFLSYCDPSQAARWLPALASGAKMSAIAMSEPGTGSDLSGMSTTATRHGDHYVLNGAKTFISGGINASLIVVVARTSQEEDRRGGLTLLVVESDMPGYSTGRNLEKIGMKYADTAELSFVDVHVPVENRLGEEGAAFQYLTSNLAQERLSVALGAVAMARSAIEVTVQYVKDRKVFGKSLSSFQNSKFQLAAASAEVTAADCMLQHAVQELDAGCLSGDDAARVKLFCSEMQGRTIDSCLQLFGGYGYMAEYPIARMYTDARISRIYGGSSEIMKTIIAKSLGL
ncbi:acyl-CoA dehydrogenase family protein [Mycolicibacterium hodleri]|uniref:Acyl-CoA dehydrogenase n=1 Tax=Mycolicibacterium hodleri TaxID=49897 RepID=A0A502E421_9MYCO|nr:acyl-CoA dehydrogenase family protein [Mycolicibacterium hodleri]TPG32455.1 acyl-CoA dehydrogenase [Mycolicibacterium hodleri]